MKKRIVLWGRFVLIALLMILQFSWILVLFYKFSYRFTYANYVIRIFAVILVIRIVNRTMNPSHKLLWTFLLLLVPIFGILFYLLFGRKDLVKSNSAKLEKIKKEMLKYMYQTPNVNLYIEKEDKIVYRQMKYINDWSGYPVYENTDTKYYKCGEELFPDMLAELERAETFIFLEYYIIEEGYMLERILEVLEKKAKAGVDVRFIYDDIGSIGTVPKDYAKVLNERGISCRAFQPFLPFLNVLVNNRDHRKMMVIDGKIGFIGGINLADEYINRIERYGYWKDTAVCLKGEAVRSLTLMFLTMWEYVGGEKENVLKFFSSNNSKLNCGKLNNIKYNALREEQIYKNGFVQPYANCPFDEEYIGENVYLNMIHQAVDYVYIFTPYLIIDNEMMISLCNAAKRGVDVRIVTPGVPDKKLIYWITQSFYQILIENGVKIYQYRPGFLHAKSFLCDDKTAVVGSVNLDYRSLYLHFECGVFLYRCNAVAELKNDYMEVFGCSDEVKIDFCKNQKLFVCLFQRIMRLLTPLL